MGRPRAAGQLCGLCFTGKDSGMPTEEKIIKFILGYNSKNMFYIKGLWNNNPITCIEIGLSKGKPSTKSG